MSWSVICSLIVLPLALASFPGVVGPRLRAAYRLGVLN